MNDDLERFIRDHPRHEKMLRDALAFLDKNEPTWQLRVPIDRLRYLKDLARDAERTARE